MLEIVSLLTSVTLNTYCCEFMRFLAFLLKIYAAREQKVAHISQKRLPQHHK